MREDTDRFGRVALIVLAVLAIAYVVAVTAIQQANIDRWIEQTKAERESQIALYDQDGTVHWVDKEDYEEAQRQWAEEHPYGI